MKIEKISRMKNGKYKIELEGQEKLVTFDDVILKNSLLFDKSIDNNLMDDNYISIDDAAAYLGIKTVTLRNWIKKKPDIPAHRVGKLWKFKRSELDEWIASGKSAE